MMKKVYLTFISVCFILFGLGVAFCSVTAEEETVTYKVTVKLVKDTVKNNNLDESEIKVIIKDSSDHPVADKYIGTSWKAGSIYWYERVNNDGNKTDKNGEIIFYHSSGEVGKITLSIIIGGAGEDFFTSVYNNGTETEAVFDIAFVKDLLDYTKPQILIKAKSSSAVYFLDNKNIRHTYPLQTIYESYWGSNFSHVKTVSDKELANFNLGSNVPFKPNSLIKMQSSPKVYEVLNGAVIRWLKTEETARYLYGNTWSQKVFDLPEGFFPDYAVAESIEIGVKYSEQ